MGNISMFAMSKKFTKQNFARPFNLPAFTLIELLVAITIIGVLTSMAVLSYNSAQRKSRDSKRKQDLAAIQRAVELANKDTIFQAYYPMCADGSGSCDPKIDGTGTSPDLAPAYIKSVPADPTTGTSTATGYTYAPTGCSASGCTA